MLGRVARAIWVTIAALSGLTSCGGVQPGRIMAPAVDPALGPASLSVHRRTAVWGSGAAYPVLLDGQPVVRLGPGETATVPVPVGSHEVVVLCGGGTPSETSTRTEFMFGAGRSYRLEVYQTAIQQTDRSACHLEMMGG
jgi:hypothetical protein